MPTYFKGHVRAPNKDHLIQVSFMRNGRWLQRLRMSANPPAAWDSRNQNWIGPVKDQGQCGCHDSATEVLTEKGWISWENYGWRDLLGTVNPITGVLEFQAPVQRHVYDYDGPLYYSDHRSVDFALTPNHRMFVRKWNEAEGTLRSSYDYVEIKDLGWYAGLPYATTGWLGARLEKISIGNRTYQGDDLISLLGLLVSDGWASTENHQVSFCCFRDDRLTFVRDLARRLGLREGLHRPGVWLWEDGDLAEWLRQNAYVEGGIYRSPFKRVPDLIKVASQDQISLFLKFFGDQHVQENGTRRFYSSSRRMINDLQELLLRIGKRGTIEERPPRESQIRDRKVRSKYPELILTERKTERLSLERKEHIREDHYRGKVYCASVPNGLLVTRRNNSTLISGNSCWDFSGTGVVEVAFNVAGVGGGPTKLVLSEEYTLSCGKNGGCGGDDNVTVLDWAKATGLPMSADYGSYDARADRCAYKPNMTLYKIDDWGFADGNGGNGVTPTVDIKASIMMYGCVGAAIAADNAFMNISAGQVFDKTTSKSIDHDIILVGWDDSKGSQGAWLLRNSWGTSWCDGGYCWIGYGVNLVGTEAVWAKLNQSAPLDWAV